MNDKIIPPEVELAAKRGFLRTTAQSYAATLSTGIPSATAVVVLIQDPTGWLLAGVTVALALLTPPIAGSASYLSILSRGISDDYVPAAVTQAPLGLLRRDIRDRQER